MPRKFIRVGRGRLGDPMGVNKRPLNPGGSDASSINYLETERRNIICTAAGNKIKLIVKTA